MGENEIQTLITQGESERVEFKRGWAADIGEKLASLANTEGGVMLIGVAADGTMVDLSEAKLAEVEEKVSNACNSVQPPLIPHPGKPGPHPFCP
jgi:predicted HTH transcriptional regulator